MSTMVVLQVTTDGFEDRYLGLQVPEERMKAGKLQPSKDKVLKGPSSQIMNFTSGDAKKTLILISHSDITNLCHGGLEIPICFM